MNQFNFHNNSKNSSFKTPPPDGFLQNELPILSKLSEAYKLWNGFFIHLGHATKYTLGEKTDCLFLDSLELILSARYAPKESKHNLLQKLSVKIDALKFFMKLLWEIKSLDNKKYAAISTSIAEIGKMVGGWMKIF